MRSLCSVCFNAWKQTLLIHAQSSLMPSGDKREQVTVSVGVPPLAAQVPSRDIEWTFENMRLLVNTDMPIFGCGKHPCVSLKLRCTQLIR